MSDNLGMGVMIGMLGGNEETVKAVNSSLGKTIQSVAQEGETLAFKFNDGTGLEVWDGGQSCCESRYMRTDDDLAYYAGTVLQRIEVADAPNQPDTYGEHEVQFLKVTTSLGVFTMASHNEHNGYYGGFWIQARSTTFHT